MRYVQALAHLAERYPELDIALINKIEKLLYRAVTSGRKILICGNGGSAADSEHIVGELVKGFLLPRRLSGETYEKLQHCKDGKALADRLQGGIPAISLVSQAAVMTAVGNDTGFDFVFAQQVMAYGKPGDILICMSTSGNSRNIDYAAQTANALGLHTVGITGKRAGKLVESCEYCLRLPAEETYQVQEYTLPVYHAICAQLEADIFAESK